MDNDDKYLIAFSIGMFFLGFAIGIIALELLSSIMQVVR